MPEFDALIADSDRQRILQWTLDQGAVLVPDSHYLEPHYEEIRSIRKLDEFASERQFFVLRADWQSEKLHIKPYVNKYKGGGFYIAQRYGGPSLSYLLYPQRTERDRPILGRGSLHYYPSYYVGSPDQQVRPADTLKAFYAAAKRFLMKGGSRIEGKVRATWVAGEATKLLADKLAFPPWTVE
jgi:hypothetical protein